MDAAEDPAQPVQLRLEGVVARRGPTTWAALTESSLALLESGETERAYRRAAREWAEWCELQGIEPMAATRAEVIEYFAQLEAEGKGRSARKQAMAGVSGVYRLGLVDGLVERDPTFGVPRPKPRESTKLGLEVADLSLLLVAADEHSPLAAALLRLYAFNGFRASEPLSVDVDQLAYVRGHTVLVDVVTKGGKVRDHVRLAKRTAAALTTYLDGRSTGPLFLRPARAGRSLDWSTPAKPRARLAYHQADRLFRGLVAATGLPPVLHLHDLRHSFVTVGLEAGAPLHHVQDDVGHADPRTTQRYNRARARLEHSTTDLVADFIESGRPPTLFD